MAGPAEPTTVVEPPAPCCPAGSHGAAAPPEGYVPRGAVEDVDGIPCYVVAASSSGAAGSGDGGRAAERAVLVGHDVFGSNSGRIKLICDELAESLGALVVCPDLFVGGCCGGVAVGDAVSKVIFTEQGVSWTRWLGHVSSGVCNLPAFLRGIKEHKWTALGPKVHEKLVPMLKQRGAKKIGLLGFCWGGWLVFRASASTDFCCGVTCHPSQAQICPMLKENFKDVCNDIQCPQMILSAKDDKPDTKEGGVAEVVFKSKAFGSDCVFKTFPAMRHGWVNRGRLEDEDIARDYQEAVNMLTEFFRKHLA